MRKTTALLSLLFPALLCAAASGAAPGLSPERKTRADVLISVFENASTELQYGYVEELHDGRGYTAGRAGFCSGTGDLVEVVRRYAARRPSAPLARFLPRLAELAERHDDSTAGLRGFPAAWRKAAADPLMRAAQDEVSDELYYLPAMKLAGELGLARDFSRAALYEAAIQHGLGDDPDGLPAMTGRASSAVKPPSAGGDERAWLGEFLKVRLATLKHASDPATAPAWAESAGRAEAMLKIFDSGNMDFDGPLKVAPYGDSFTIP